MADEQISVVGGGVIGLSTGTLLNRKGYDTAVYTREVPYEDTELHSLATNYAAASVKPVVVDEDDIGRLTRISDGFYARLEEETDTVSRQDNFELHEGRVDEPEYSDDLMNYRTVEEYDGVVPGTDTPVSGWVHEIFFVDMPSYIPWLIETYEATGGTVERREVTRDEVGSLPGDVVVNCTGLGGLFEDDELVPRRGHLVDVELETDGRLRGKNGERFSYSYYLEEGGFVYAYPRRGHLLFGGTNQSGEVVEGEWEGEEEEKVIELPGEEVPERLVSLNRELIESKSGVDIDGCSMRGRYGYRPYRRGGIRNEKETYDGKEVVHNYGHGGAGVTLSWYSASRVYNIISGSEGHDFSVLDGVGDV